MASLLAWKPKQPRAWYGRRLLQQVKGRSIQPHIPVIDRRDQTRGGLTRDAFQYDPTENTFGCPEGKWLRYRGVSRSGQSYVYSDETADCGNCRVKKRCTPGPYRNLPLH